MAESVPAIPCSPPTYTTEPPPHLVHMIVQSAAAWVYENDHEASKHYLLLPQQAINSFPAQSDCGAAYQEGDFVLHMVSGRCERGEGGHVWEGGREGTSSSCGAAYQDGDFVLHMVSGR